VTPSDPQPHGIAGGPWRVVAAAWPLLLGAAVFAAFGRYGFNPTDEGFVNDAAYRILNGQVPHRDFVWARPGGTALLHIPELLLPLPLVLLSRAIALAQIIGYTILFGILVLRRPPWRWAPWEVLLGSAAVLLNLNTMLLTVWPTFDGLLLVAGGAVLQQRWMHRADPRAGRGALALAFLLYGASTLMKQSFWPAPIFGLVWLLMGSSRSTWARSVPIALGIAALAPAAYLGWMALSGGMDEMLLQFRSARPALGLELVTELPEPLLVAALTAAVALVIWVAPGGGVLVRAAAPVLVALAAGAIVVFFGLRLSGGWGSMLLWIGAGVVVVSSLRRSAIDWPGMVLLGCGWMVSLSYGLAVPNLVAGSLVLYVVVRAWEAVVSGTGRRAGLVGLAAAVAVAVPLLPVFVSERLDRTYRDRPAAELTADLGSVDADFAGVLTNPTTAAYLEQIVSCVEAYPASRVAILPDNPMIYPVLGLENPFPVVWIIPLEIRGSEDRIVDAARAIDETGDYLVLFQPVEARRLAVVDGLAKTEAGPFRDAELGERIRREFTGNPVTCGDFEGFRSP
jgi:hypothetical protein